MYEKKLKSGLFITITVPFWLKFYTRAYLLLMYYGHIISGNHYLDSEVADVGKDRLLGLYVRHCKINFGKPKKKKLKHTLTKMLKRYI